MWRGDDLRQEGQGRVLGEHWSWVGKGRAGAGNKGESAGGVTQTTGAEFSCRLGKDEQ